MKHPAGLTLLAALLAAAGPAGADEILLPQPPLTRAHEITALYHADRPGRARLTIAWTDDAGRLVSRQTLTTGPGHDTRFPLDLRRAVAMGNTLHAHLSAPGRQIDTETSFIAQPPDDAWRDYQVILWQARNAVQYHDLKPMGLTAGTLIADRDGTFPPFQQRIAPLLANNLRWYVENIATDFYSAYHRWDPPHAVNWRFQAVQERYRNNPDDDTALMREPSLSDTAWQARIDERLRATVRQQAQYRPLYYSLGDETGIADLSAFWDFDFSPASLRGMRAWLRTQYPSLAALNREWGTHFITWHAVVPETTRQAMARGDDNFASWSDFKAWMDVAYATALRHGTDAVHAADPTAHAAIEGSQAPGWGGYDYRGIARAVDAIEIDDVGQSLAIMRSLAPRTIKLTTSFGSDPRGIYYLYQAWLRGTRGLILWDDQGNLLTPGGGLAPRAQAYAPHFARLQGGLGMQVIAAHPVTNPIAILYSPASFRAQWMLDQRPKGDAWMRRTADDENAPNAQREAVDTYAAGLAALGYRPRWITPEQLAAGQVDARVLILPHVLALSDRAAKSVAQFAAAGGAVLADIIPGAFDEHCRRRAQPVLAQLFGARRARIVSPDSGLDAALRDAGLHPGFPLSTTQAETYVYRVGTVTIVAVQRTPPGDATVLPATLSLPAPAYVTDLMNGQDFGRTDRVALKLGAAEPAILALSHTPPAPPLLHLPATARAGQTVRLTIRLRHATPHALHVAVIDPTGSVAKIYSGNELAGFLGEWTIPFALNDPTGTWTVQVTDVLGAKTTTGHIRLTAP